MAPKEPPKNEEPVAPPANNNTGEDIATEEAPKKRSRANTRSSETTHQPKTKKGRKNQQHPKDAVEDPGTDFVEKFQTVKQKVNKAVESREPLPERVNRVQNPGLVDQKTGRRTSAQVIKEDQRRDALEQEVARLKAEKMELLAQMEVNQQREEEEENRMLITNITEARAALRRDSDSAEPGDGDENDEGSSRARKKSTTRQKKPERGEARGAVEVLKAKIKNQGTAEGRVDLSTPPRAPTPRPKHLTGLVVGWTPAPVRQPSATSTIKSDAPPLGGLNDDDIAAEAPDLAELSSARKQWSNDLVLVVSSDPESETAKFNEAPDLVRTPAPRAPRKHPKTTVSTQVVPYKGTPTPVKREGSASSTNSFLLSTPVPSDVDSHLLPEFVQSEWLPRFLPTLYHCILSNDDPFENFLGGNALKMIQSVVNIVFPEIPDYKVAYRSRLYEMAYERGTDLRARFASHAIKIVKKFFDQSEYKNNPDAISRYVRWAIRDDGPMLFRVPAPEVPPEEGTFSSKALDPFQSPFIIELVTPILKCLRGSVGHHTFGEPKAALALAAAGLERAFLSFESGKFNKPTQTFGSEAVGDVVKEYMESVNNFTERRWKQVKAACGVEAEMKHIAVPSSSSLNGKRRKLYVASSPPPEIVDNFGD